MMYKDLITRGAVQRKLISKRKREVENGDCVYAPGQMDPP